VSIATIEIAGHSFSDRDDIGECPMALARSGFRHWRRVVFVGAALAAFGAGEGIAQTYPNRTIRIIVPFPAGGLNDTAARLDRALSGTGAWTANHCRQPPGCERHRRDGCGRQGAAGRPHAAHGDLDSHDRAGDECQAAVRRRTRSAAVALIGTNPFLFVVGAKVPARTLAEFITLAKANPGKLNYATVGAASQAHLVTEWFSQRAGIKMQHIPYRGGAPAVMAMVTGDTEFVVISPLASLPHIQAGALRAIAASSLTRDPQFASIPTVAEEGFPGFEALQWVGLLTTANTPKAIVDRLNAAVNKAIREPDLIRKLADQGVSAAGGSADDFQKRIATEIRDWTEIARVANIKAE